MSNENDHVPNRNCFDSSGFIIRVCCNDEGHIRRFFVLGYEENGQWARPERKRDEDEDSVPYERIGMT